MNEAIGLQLQQVERKYKLNTPVNKGKLHVNTEPYSFSKIPDFPGNLIGLYTLISFSFKKKVRRFLQLYLFNLRFLLMSYFLYWAVSIFIIIYLFIYFYFALLLLSHKFQEFNINQIVMYCSSRKNITKIDNLNYVNNMSLVIANIITLLHFFTK